MKNWNMKILVNCYSNGNISCTYSGGIMGTHSWNTCGEAGTGINCYYQKSDTVNNSVGRKESTYTDELISSKGITEVTQDLIDSLNRYILNNQEGYVTTDWNTWTLDENGY